MSRWVAESLSQRVKKWKSRKDYDYDNDDDDKFSFQIFYNLIEIESLSGWVEIGWSLQFKVYGLQFTVYSLKMLRSQIIKH